MSTKDRLDGLRSAAEVAVGAMRAEAEALLALHDLLPESQQERRLMLSLSAERLISHAVSLTVEISASNPSNARKILEVVGTVLISIGPAMAGAGAGAATTHALEAHERTVQCVEQVQHEADVAITAEVNTVTGAANLSGPGIVGSASGHVTPGAAGPIPVGQGGLGVGGEQHEAESSPATAAARVVIPTPTVIVENNVEAEDGTDMNALLREDWERTKGERPTLVIMSALFGTGDNQRDVTQLVRSRVVNDRLSMPVDYSTLGDPLPGTGKWLVVRYSLNGVEQPEERWPEQPTPLIAVLPK